MDDSAEPQQNETNASTPNSSTAAANATKAPKDRQCPFCGQAFTSSSLGRHLDLYIKPKNPKPPDGIHNVEDIKRIRGAITRRQPRNSLKAGSGGTVNVRQELNGATEHQSAETDEATGQSGSTHIDDGSTPSSEKRREHNRVYSMWNAPDWQATGVINNLPPRAPSRGNSDAASGQAHRINEMRRDADGSKIQRPDYDSESYSRLQEAAQLGRAAEMALREVLGSLEAAQKRTQPKLLYDEFDFFALTFPGLCLAILPAPTTLFGQTPFANAESWTLGPPGRRQYEAMVRFLNERYNARRKSETLHESVAFRHHSHLSGAWEHWQTLSESDCASAWTLEILRSFARAQEQSKQLRTELDAAQHQSRHLEAEYDRLSRCQLPREYLLHPPNTIPISKEVLSQVQSSTYKSEAAATSYDADALLAKWRSQIRATTRPSRAAPPPKASSTPGYNATSCHDAALPSDMVMNGSVWNVNGPMPRQSAFYSAKHYATQDFDYETPRQPGGIVSGDDEDADGNAEGEANEAADQYPGQQSALVKRHQAGQNDGTSPGGASLRSGATNSNGKRPPTPSTAGGRGAFKIYKERHEAGEGEANARTSY